MPRRKRQRRRSVRGAPSTPSESKHPELPPKDNVARCSVCKRITDACLIEISRRLLSRGDIGIVVRRGYACRKHAAQVAADVVKELSYVTYWGEREYDESEEILSGEAVDAADIDPNAEFGKGLEEAGPDEVESDSELDGDADSETEEQA